MRKMRKIWLLILIFLLLPLFACGGGGGSSGSTPPSVNLIYPYDKQLIGGVMTAEVATSECTGATKLELLVDGIFTGIRSDSCKYLDFDANQFATGMHTLAIQVNDTVVSPGITVKVDPVELRKEALQFLTTYNTFGTHSGVRRWASLPIVLEISSEIVQDGFFSAYQEAADFWTKYTGITFNVISSAESQVENPMTGKLGVVFFEYGTPLYGATMGTWTNVDLNSLTHIASVVTVANGYGNNKTIIAHEIGHSLGMGEVNDGTITDHSSATWRMDPVTSKAMKILYFELAPGSQVPFS